MIRLPSAVARSLPFRIEVFVHESPEPGPLLRSLSLAPDAIEPLSIARIEAEAGALRWLGEERRMAVRIAYAVGDSTVLADFDCSAGAVAAGVEALRKGAAIVTDVRMVAVGIDRARAAKLGVEIFTSIDVAEVAEVARARGITRSAQAILSLASRLDGAIVAIGNAPTALFALLDLVDAGLTKPALILGFPVGYVAAAESKEELVRRAIPYVTMRGRRGGTPMTVSAANTLLRLATAEVDAAPQTGAAAQPDRTAPQSRIQVVGIGDDGLAGLGSRARRIIASAKTFYGGTRQLDMVSARSSRKVNLSTDYEMALSELVSGDCGDGAVVLASGDPMLFGIGSTLAAKFGHEAASRMEVTTYPSSVQLALATLGEPATNVTVASVVGRPLRAALAVVAASERSIVLLDPKNSAAVVARGLLDAGLEDAPAAVCERLGGAAERVTRGTLSSIAGIAGIAAAAFDPLSVLAVLRNSDEAGGYRRSAIPEAEFAHRAGQITKAEVRALAIATLRLSPDDTLWDIGAGSGSVSVEAALGLPRGVVYAIDPEAGQIEFIRTNSVRFRTPQVEAVLGAAPDALEALPDPDAVFLGGGGPAQEAIVDAVTRRLRPGGRFAATLVTIERVAPLMRQLAAWSPQLRQVSIMHGVPIGDGTRLSPANPVFLISATKPAGPPG